MFGDIFEIYATFVKVHVKYDMETDHNFAYNFLWNSVYKSTITINNYYNRSNNMYLPLQAVENSDSNKIRYYDHC